DRLHRAERGTAGRDHILDDRHAVTFAEGPFDQAPSSVCLCLLAHGKSTERSVTGRAGVCDRVADRIGAEREPADCVHLPATLTKSGEREWADERQTIR